MGILHVECGVAKGGAVGDEELVAPRSGLRSSGDETVLFQVDEGGVEHAHESAVQEALVKAADVRGTLEGAEACDFLGSGGDLVGGFVRFGLATHGACAEESAV